MNLRKTLVLTGVFLGVFAFANPKAQAEDFSITFTAGPNLANIGGDDASDDADMRLGLNAGGLANYALSDQFAVQGGLQFSSKGTTQEIEMFDPDDPTQTVEADIEQALSYLDVPLLAAFHPVEGVSLFGGLQPSILVDAEFTTENGDEETEDISDAITDVDFAIALGAGYTHESGFGLRAGYDLGLSSTDDVGDDDVFNRVIKISLAYDLSL